VAPDEKDDDMKDITGGRRLRASVLAAALAGTALFGAACGGKTPAAGPQQTASRYQQAVAYAKCMRSHGDPAWPDPNSNGMFGNNNGSLDESSAAYKAANKACAKLQSGNNAPAPAQQQQALAQLLKYSQCMRAHGISKYPDPTTDAGGGVGISFQGNIGQHTPQFTAAQQACQSLIPGPGQ
jgi:hypothetical protein